MNARRLCHLDDLTDPGARGFDLTGSGRDDIFLVRRDGRVYAWRNACPHIEGAAMAWRKDAYLSADASVIVCAAHGARFDIASGLCLLGPCVGQALSPLALRISDAGDVLLL